jgi:ribosomal protein S17E
MFVKTYEFQDSSAIFTIKMGKESVFVTYNSNIDKEYEFNCENITEFEENVSKTLKEEKSIGKLVHSYIKEGKLVAVTK